MSLSATESYINKNKHLPNIPSAAEVLAEGISLGQMSKLQMEKIEELTLHMITINKDKENLEKQVETAAQRIARLEAQNTLLLERMAAIEAFLNK
jgi:predicted  nucleic acid-binding Zn-ribbon protein